MSFVSLSYMLLFLPWPKIGLALRRIPPAVLSIDASFSSELDSSAIRLGLFRLFALKGLCKDYGSIVFSLLTTMTYTLATLIEVEL